MVFYLSDSLMPPTATKTFSPTSLRVKYNNWPPYYQGFNTIQFFNFSIAKYKKAIELKPKFAFAYVNWGDALLEQGKYKGAIDKFNEAIGFDEKKAYAYYGLSLASWNKNNSKDTLENLQMAIERDPVVSNILRLFSLFLYFL